MPASELADWQAYFQVEPWGTHAAETLVATLIQAIIASNGGKPPQLDKLMPFYTTIKQAQQGPQKKTAEQMLAEARAALSSGRFRVVR